MPKAQSEKCIIISEKLHTHLKVKAANTGKTLRKVTEDILEKDYNEYRR